MDKVIIEGTQAQVISPEGQTVTVTVEEFVRSILLRHTDSRGVVLPEGVLATFSEGPVTVWVHQTPPRVYRFRWIATDSEVPFGPGTKYRTVRISLPYLIVLAVFEPGEDPRIHLSQRNECFFRNAPLTSADDELFFPALLNCSKFEPEDGRPLSWICTQFLDRRPLVREPDTHKRMSMGLAGLLRCLLEAGFNFSSEHHEFSSWYSESTRIDPRISTVEAWEAATLQKPDFVLDVPWLKTGRTLKQLAERIFRIGNAHCPPPATSADLARLILNRQK